MHLIYYTISYTYVCIMLYVVYYMYMYESGDLPGVRGSPLALGRHLHWFGSGRWRIATTILLLMARWLATKQIHSQAASLVKHFCMRCEVVRCLLASGMFGYNVLACGVCRSSAMMSSRDGYLTLPSYSTPRLQCRLMYVLLPISARCKDLYRGACSPEIWVALLYMTTASTCCARAICMVLCSQPIRCTYATSCNICSTDVRHESGTLRWAFRPP